MYAAFSPAVWVPFLKYAVALEGAGTFKVQVLFAVLPLVLEWFLGLSSPKWNMGIIIMAHAIDQMEPL